MSNDSEDGIVPVEQALPVGVDDYSDIELSEGVKNRLGRLVMGRRVGLVSTAPIVCKGPSYCPFIARCPFYQEGEPTDSYPVSKQCIVEVNITADTYSGYLEEYEDRFGEVGPTARAQLSKLAELDLMDFRLQMIIAGVVQDDSAPDDKLSDVSNQSMLLKQVVAITKHDDEISAIDIHPAVKQQERIHKQRQEILDNLCLTQRRQVWLEGIRGVVEQNNIMSHWREVADSFSELVKLVKEKE